VSTGNGRLKRRTSFSSKQCEMHSIRLHHIHPLLIGSGIFTEFSEAWHFRLHSLTERSSVMCRYRIKDPKISLDFYTRIIGMQLISKLDFPDMNFSLYFLGFHSEEDIPDDPKDRVSVYQPELFMCRTSDALCPLGWTHAMLSVCRWSGCSSSPQVSARLEVCLLTVQSVC
jgi:hypothetical protein